MAVYFLTVTGALDPAGNLILPDGLLFVLEAEEEPERQFFLDTDMGAVKFAFRTITRRRIEDLVVQRAKDVGFTKQFELIAEALKDSGIDRDVKLNLFKK